jgi:CspA family cold shock protein
MMRFNHVERRANKRPARQNVADRYYQSSGSGAVMTDVRAVDSGSKRYNGTVKFFNPDRGYGFIRRDGGQDVFVHANELRKSGIVDLSPIVTGSKLEFEVEMVPNKGPKAVNLVQLPEAEA